MSPSIAVVACALVILTVFRLNRDRGSGVSPALWLPSTWLSLSASRPVSLWLGGVVPYASADAAFVEGSPLDALIWAALLAAGLVVLISRRRHVGTFLRANVPLLVFLLYCGLSVQWSDYPVVAFKRWTKAIGDLVMVLIVLTDPEPTAAMKRLLARSGFLLIPLSILLIRYYPSLGRGYSDWTGEAYNHGVATQKNGLGYICLLFGLGSLWYLLEAFRSGRRPRATGPLIAHGAVLAMALWLFVMADSATSFGCFVIGGGLIALMRLRALARTPAAVHLVVGAVLVVVLYGVLLEPRAGLVEAVGRDSTLTGRTAIWNQLLGMTVDPLFGAGYESFWLGARLEKMWQTNPEHPNQAHNGYLEVFLDLGWVGLTLLAVVMASGCWSVVRALRRDPEAARLKLAFFVVAAIYNLTEHAFRELHPVWIAFLLAVIIVPEHSRREVA
jgi:hypothetical protein